MFWMHFSGWCQTKHAIVCKTHPCMDFQYEQNQNELKPYERCRVMFWLFFVFYEDHRTLKIRDIIYVQFFVTKFMTRTVDNWAHWSNLNLELIPEVQVPPFVHLSSSLATVWLFGIWTRFFLLGSLPICIIIEAKLCGLVSTVVS